MTVVGTANDGEAALPIAEAARARSRPARHRDARHGRHRRRPRAFGTPAVDPAIVFVTAFDNFAVAAFDVAAIDYLMKPVLPERLERALERVRAHLAGGGAASRQARAAYVEEFWVPDHSGLVRIAARDIERVTAERDYMRLHVGQRSWLIHRTIAKLEEELDPALFLRVHRSVMLRRDTITGLYRDDAAPLDGAAKRRRRAAHRPLLCRRGEALRGPLSLHAKREASAGHRRLP